MQSVRVKHAKASSKCVTASGILPEVSTSEAFDFAVFCAPQVAAPRGKRLRDVRAGAAAFDAERLASWSPGEPQPWQFVYSVAGENLLLTVLNLFFESIELIHP